MFDLKKKTTTIFNCAASLSLVWKSKKIKVYYIFPVFAKKKDEKIYYCAPCCPYIE